MAKRYRIATVADLLTVPAERRGECLRELELALSFCELAGSSFAAFTWADDGDKSVTIEVNGKPLVTLKVEPATIHEQKEQTK